MKKFLKKVFKEVKPYLVVLKYFIMVCIWLAVVISCLTLICEASTISVIIGVGGIVLAIAFAVKTIIRLSMKEKEEKHEV